MKLLIPAENPGLMMFIVRALDLVNNKAHERTL